MDKLIVPETSAVTRPYVNAQGVVVGRIGVDFMGGYFAEPIRVNPRGERYYAFAVQFHETQDEAEAELVALTTDEGGHHANA